MWSMLGLLPLSSKIALDIFMGQLKLGDLKSWSYYTQYL